MLYIYRDGVISSEELAVFDVQDVDQYYYHGQHAVDQVIFYYCFMPDRILVVNTLTNDEGLLGIT